MTDDRVFEPDTVTTDGSARSETIETDDAAGTLGTTAKDDLPNTPHTDVEQAEGAVAGGVVGALVGAVAGGPIGAVVGGAIGAFSGAAVGAGVEADAEARKDEEGVAARDEQSGPTQETTLMIELVSWTGGHKGDVVGTLVTGPAGTLITTGDGQKWVDKWPVISDHDTARKVKPSDGDAYLRALIHQFQTGFYYARIADDSAKRHKG